MRKFEASIPKEILPDVAGVFFDNEYNEFAVFGSAKSENVVVQVSYEKDDEYMVEQIEEEISEMVSDYQSQQEEDQDEK